MESTSTVTNSKICLNCIFVVGFSLLYSTPFFSPPGYVFDHEMVGLSTFFFC